MSKQTEKSFNHLLELTNEAFVNSNAKSLRNDWNFEIMPTRIEVGNGLILGFNAGVKRGFHHKPQKGILNTPLDIEKKQDGLVHFRKYIVCS